MVTDFLVIGQDCITAVVFYTYRDIYDTFESDTVDKKVDKIAIRKSVLVDNVIAGIWLYFYPLGDNEKTKKLDLETY